MLFSAKLTSCLSVSMVCSLDLGCIVLDEQEQIAVDPLLVVLFLRLVENGLESLVNLLFDV